MSLPNETRVADLLKAYVPQEVLTPELICSIQAYLDLLLKWNARTNLTAVRDPEVLVQRQFGESLFCARLLPEVGNLLDFGSGAGFPGIPIQMVRPGLHVTLAESQGKKASFLREAVRALNLTCEVWPKRVEALPADLVFDIVTMRAVDASATMLPIASARVAKGGLLVRYTRSGELDRPKGWQVTADLAVPCSAGRLQLLKRPV